MRWAWVMLALCACDRVFGLSPTIAIDAQKFDAAIDAPYACPPLGTPLEFSPALHQIHQFCQGYTASAVTGRALAMCYYGASRTELISDGPLDGPLAPLAGMPVNDTTLSVSNPVLGVDGDLMFVPTLDLMTFVPAVRQYQRDGSGAWLRGNDFSIAGVVTISQASHGPDHRVVYGLGATVALHEASDASGTWQKVADFSLASLNVPSVGPVWLSPDGLRMVVVANVLTPADEYLVYTDRTALDQPFRPATRLDAASGNDPYITPDCSRLYFSGLESLFYANQR